MEIKIIEISTEYIKAGQLLKWIGIAEKGSDAKRIISDGEVKLNGEVISERGKKIKKGDQIEYHGTIYEIC